MKKKTIITNLIIFVAILIFLNLVSLSIFTRIDLSKGHIYSLSKASKRVAKELEDRLVIKAYFSKNLPGEYADAKRYTQDILSEYQAYSRGKLRYEFIDPSDEESLKEEAGKNQIFPVQMRVIENDKLEIREVYLGLAFLYQDKTESIPLVQNTQGLEYDITKLIKKITAQGMKKLAFFQTEPVDEMAAMQGQMNPNDVHATVRQLLTEGYEVSVTDLYEPVDAAVTILVFSGIKDSLSQNQLFNLDQFIMSGKNVIFFQDRVKTEIQTQQASLIESNLFDMLRNYGIFLKSNLVTDAQCGQVQIQRQQGMFRFMTPVSYPFFPVINNVNKENMIVKNLDQLQLIFASEIDTLRLNEGQSFEPLLFTSPNSGEVKAPRLDISIQSYMNANLRAMLIDPGKIVSGIYSGRFDSYFGNNEVFPEALQSTTIARILVVADADFIQDTGGAGVPGNLDFVLNSVDYMASEGTLIEIRSRETAFKPLKEISSASRKLVKWGNILLPSLLLILIGIIRYRNEIKRRKYLGELYE
jgi:gliding motility-associatede transport system auxiliary component